VQQAGDGGRVGLQGAAGLGGPTVFGEVGGPPVGAEGRVPRDELQQDHPKANTSIALVMDRLFPYSGARYLHQPSEGMDFFIYFFDK